MVVDTEVRKVFVVVYSRDGKIQGYLSGSYEYRPYVVRYRDGHVHWVCDTPLINKCCDGSTVLAR